MFEEGNSNKKEEKFKEWDVNKANMVEEAGNWTLPADLDHAWEATEEAKSQDVPPGVYTVVVDTVERRTSQSGNRMLSWTLKITEGEHKERNLFKNHVFLPQSLPYVKADFSLCKVVLSPPLTQSIENSISQLLGIILKVSVKAQKNGEGVNVYFKEYLGKLVTN